MTDEELSALRSTLPNGTQITLVKSEDEWMVVKSAIVPRSEVRMFRHWRIYLILAGLGWKAYVDATDQFASHVPKAEVLVTQTLDYANVILRDLTAGPDGLDVKSPQELEANRFIAFRQDGIGPPAAEPPPNQLVEGVRYISTANVSPTYLTQVYLRPSGSGIF